MTSSNIKTKFLKRLGECGLVEEGVGRVGESSLKEVLVDKCVELVCFNNH